jgi:hypothetical protein
MRNREDLERLNSALLKIKNPNPVEAERRETGAEEEVPRLTRQEVKTQKDIHRSHFDVNFGEYIKVDKETGASQTKNWMPQINLPKINLPSINFSVGSKGKPKGIYLKKGKRLSTKQHLRRRKKLGV